MDDAVNVCISEIERGERRVETVDGVNREGANWRVDGQIRDGRSYSCSADSDGRVRRLAIDGQAVI